MDSCTFQFKALTFDMESNADDGLKDEQLLQRYMNHFKKRKRNLKRFLPAIDFTIK